jgi:hypothetical protein
MRYTKQIREFIKNKPKFTNKQIYAQFPNLTHKQVSMAMFKLKSDNMIRRIAFGKWENLTLTSVNKTPVIQFTNTAKSKEIADLKVKLEQATQDILHWHRLAKENDEASKRLTTVQQQLDDALSIIRYLEEKLFVAIQLNAKNNGNA